MTVQDADAMYPAQRAAEANYNAALREVFAARTAGNTADLAFWQAEAREHQDEFRRILNTRMAVLSANRPAPAPKVHYCVGRSCAAIVPAEGRRCPTCAERAQRRAIRNYGPFA